MRRDNLNFKSIAITTGLIFLLILVFYSFIGILISGPLIKYEEKERITIAKIEEDNKDVKNIKKHVFRYVIYTGETEESYIFFNKAGMRVAIRDKKDAKFDKVKDLIKKEYPTLDGVEINLGYGKDKPAYIIEKNYEVLVLNFDDLKEVFYMKENE